MPEEREMNTEAVIRTLRPKEKLIWGFHEEVSVDDFRTAGWTLLRVHGHELTEASLRSVQNALAAGTTVRLETSALLADLCKKRPKLVQQVTIRPTVSRL